MALLAGGNSSTSGFTDRCRQTAEVFGPAIMLWLPSAGPQDAVPYPDCVHIVRLPNWSPGTMPDQYCREVRGPVTAWRALIPGAIFCLGNEPDLEAGHHGQAVRLYAQAMHDAYPGIRVGNPPLSVEASQRVVADECDVVLMHSYFERQHPETMSWVQFGRSYQYGLDIANGRPVYVAEVNVVQTALDDWQSSDPAVAQAAWTDRNDKLTQWLNQAAADGVAGAAIFIFDASADWASYDVGPEAAAAIRAGISTSQPPDPVPPLPPEPEAPPVTIYDPAMNPLTGAPPVAAWVPHIALHNSVEAEDIVNAYRRFAPVIRYDANLALAQAALETAWFTHPRWTESRNPAGIGITGDAVAGYDFGTIDRGVQSHLALLNCYYGNGVDPWGPLTEADYGRFILGFTRLDQMNGVWAVPGTHYAQTIVQITNEVTGGAVPPALPLPPPASAQEWIFVQPVDAPIIQGSDGDFSHAGRSPGFYALDYAPLPMNSPVYAIADGEVTYNGFNHPQEGQTGHTLCLHHHGGYESRYCHLNQYDPPVGTQVRQSEQIALSGAPDYPYPGANGFGAGPHLHFSILQFGRWVKCEELMAQGMMAPIGVTSGTNAQDKWETAPMVGDGFDDNEILRLWYGTANPTQTAKEKFPYNHDFGIEMSYRDLANGNFNQPDQDLLGKSIVLGKCISREEADAGTPGRSVRYFESGKITALRQEDGSYTFRVN